MADEQVVVEDQETLEQPQEVQAPQYSDAEIHAMETGWKPKDQYTGPEGKWVDAEEYLRRGELFDKIDTLGRELKDTKKALRMLQEHHAKVREVSYQEALQELKAQKAKAYAEGDADKLAELDEKIIDVKAAQKDEQAAIKAQAKAPDPRFVQWVEKNSWYAQDPELRVFADQVGLAYVNSNPDKDPVEVLRYVEQRVKKSFADKFSNPNRTKQSVEGSVASKPSRKDDDVDLSDEERKVMNTFVRQGIMTAEEYKKQIKKVRG